MCPRAGWDGGRRRRPEPEARVLAEDLAVPRVAAVTTMKLDGLRGGVLVNIEGLAAPRRRGLVPRTFGAQLRVRAIDAPPSLCGGAGCVRLEILPGLRRPCAPEQIVGHVSANVSRWPTRLSECEAVFSGANEVSAGGTRLLADGLPSQSFALAVWRRLCSLSTVQMTRTQRSREDGPGAT